MRQVPEINLDLYHSLNSNEFIPNNASESAIYKWLGHYHAYGAKVGDFSTNYFNYLKIKEIIAAFLLLFIGQDSSSLAILSIAIALYFALNSLANDLLLFIPSEASLEIKDFFSGKRKTENQKNKIFKTLSAPVLYPTFAILSANSAAGILAISTASLPARILSAFVSILGTELGIFYSHMVFAPRIKDFEKLINDFIDNFSVSLKKIIKNPIITLQIIKFFGIISFNYTTMGVFYLYSLAEELSQAFSFSINDYPLTIAMGIATILVFITNIIIRFPATLNKSISSSNFFLESLISLAGLTLSIRRVEKNPQLAVSGIVTSFASLAIGLGSIYLRPETKPTAHEQNHFLTHWLNAHSRLIKSTFLPFAAINKICKALKDHDSTDLGLDTLDIICLVAIMGIPLGINSSAMYKSSINDHLNYINEKWCIENEDPQFGKFGCLFASNQDYPLFYSRRLKNVLNNNKSAAEPYTPASLDLI